MKIPGALRNREVQAGLLLWALLALAACALWPGLSGGFVIDDFVNLEDLEDISKLPTLDTYLRFILNGVSSPLGRPLAMVTFALQHHDWPEHPEAFIHVNVMLHLVNVCLVYWIFLRLAELDPAWRGPARHALPLAATALWLFAAPQAGAVLYVVQRMTVLAATCMFAGLLLHLHGRRHDSGGRPLRGAVFMAAGFAAGAGVGYLAKETAALYPLLVLCLEATLLRDVPRTRLGRAAAVVLLVVPTIAVLVKLAGYVPWQIPEGFRNFTLGERLLSEPRILFAYLSKTLVPPLYGMRVYYDDIAVSRSLFSPWTTLPSLLGWIAIAAAAVALRRRAPPFTFAAAWFLAAHLLEATVIPLELAFDHRNYVALLGPAFALAWYAGRLLAWPRVARIRPAVAAGLVAYAAFVVGTFSQTAAFWGQPWELAHYWAQVQPESRRAQLSAGRFYWSLRRPDEAVAVHERALERWPGDIAFFLSILETGCAFPGLPQADLRRIPAIMAQWDSTVPGTVGALDTLVEHVERGLCPRYTPAELWTIVQMVFEQPLLAWQKQNRLLLESRIAELAHDRKLARQRLDAAMTAAEPDARMYRNAIVWALGAQNVMCARSYLARYEASLAHHPVKAIGQRAEIEGLREFVEKFAKVSPDKAPDEASCQNPPPAP